jgi:hypothetical protein
LILVFILDSLLECGADRKIILVTERKKLLNRLNWGKNGFPKLPPHSILNPKEAITFIDLYCKRKNKFLLAPNFYSNKGLWYSNSLKNKLSNYQKIWPIIIRGEGDFSQKKNW